MLKKLIFQIDNVASGKAWLSLFYSHGKEASAGTADLSIHELGFDMAFSNKFSNMGVRAFLRSAWQHRVVAGSRTEAPDAEQAYLAAAFDHQDLERRLRVLDCRHGSVLHTLRVMKISSY